MTDEFKIIISNEGEPDIESPSPNKSGGSGGGIGDMISSLVGSLGPLVIIAGIVSQFKPLMGMIKGIMRILMEFLRPIAEIIMLLLKPILDMLRPILVVFRELMAPFRKIAYSYAAQASQARAEGDTETAAKYQLLSTTAMTAGLGVGIQAIFGEVIKMMIDNMAVGMTMLVTAIGEFFKLIPGISDDGVDDIVSNVNKFITDGAQTIKDGIDSVISWQQTQALKGLQTMSEMLGIKVEGSFTDLVKPGSRINASIDGFKVSIGNQVAKVFEDLSRDISQGNTTNYKRSVVYTPDTNKIILDTVMPLNSFYNSGSSFSGGYTGGW